MIVVEEAAEVCTVRGTDIQLAFRYLGDRWQHFVSVRRNGDWSRLFTSEEGSPDAGALPSPALQDLRLERISDNVVEFQLLGQAGKGVYSAAVRFDGKSQEIDFDLCARGRSADSPLCTQTVYLLGDRVPGLTIEIPRSNALVVRLQRGLGIEISPVLIPDNPPTECRAIGQEGTRQIAAGWFGSRPLDRAGKGFSIRWRYRIAPSGHP